MELYTTNNALRLSLLASSSQGINQVLSDDFRSWMLRNVPTFMWYYSQLTSLQAIKWVMIGSDSNFQKYSLCYNYDLWQLRYAPFDGRITHKTISWKLNKICHFRLITVESEFIYYVDRLCNALMLTVDIRQRNFSGYIDWFCCYREFCELTVETVSCWSACSSGSFGWTCALRCNCKDDEVCDPVTGECPTGCDDDHWGVGCLLGNVAGLSTQHNLIA